MTSKALEDFNIAIGHAERLMQGTKTGRGKPNAQEKSMFVAAVVLTYAAWEGYVEDVAIEITKHLATETAPEAVPASARKGVEQMNPTAWQYSVHPGWRGLWQDSVKIYAKGTDDDNPPFGMNTANLKNVNSLFNLVGINPWSSAMKAEKGDIDKLVRLRGTVAHTGSTPENFNKGVAQEHLDRVRRIVADMDKTILAEASKVTPQSSAW